ncbi:MAG: pentapeptide repeat-containing protein [Bacteroidota bacterium]
MDYTASAHLKGKDYLANSLPVGEYEDCIFEDCTFLNADVSRVAFVDCEFINCDLSNANINLAAFREVQFSGCKMLGLRFDNANDFLFSVGFSRCRLDSSVFYMRSLKSTLFDQCSLKEVDFTETDLSGASFNSCDLFGATFDRTNLEKADLRGAENYIIDPDNNRIRSARFSISGVSGLLSKYSIHIE